MWKVFAAVELVARVRSARELQREGVVRAWFANSDSMVRRVTVEANGPAIEELVRLWEYPDAACAEEVFRQGADVLGEVLYTDV